MRSRPPPPDEAPCLDHEALPTDPPGDPEADHLNPHGPPTAKTLEESKAADFQAQEFKEADPHHTGDPPVEWHPPMLLDVQMHIPKSPPPPLPGAGFTLAVTSDEGVETL